MKATQAFAESELMPESMSELMEDQIAENSSVNVTELGKHVKRKRETERLSLRAVAKQTQVSASTLSRIENGTGVPDTPTLTRLARWLNIPFERVVGNGNAADAPIVYYPKESLPDIVAAHLRADPNLTPDVAHALEEVFRVAYTQFSQKKSPSEG